MQWIDLQCWFLWIPFTARWKDTWTRICLGMSFCEVQKTEEEISVLSGHVLQTFAFQISRRKLWRRRSQRVWQIWILSGPKTSKENTERFWFTQVGSERINSELENQENIVGKRNVFIWRKQFVCRKFGVCWRKEKQNILCCRSRIVKNKSLPEDTSCLQTDEEGKWRALFRTEWSGVDKNRRLRKSLLLTDGQKDVTIICRLSSPAECISPRNGRC